MITAWRFARTLRLRAHRPRRRRLVGRAEPRPRSSRGCSSTISPTPPSWSRTTAASRRSSSASSPRAREAYIHFVGVRPAAAGRARALRAVLRAPPRRGRTVVPASPRRGTRARWRSTEARLRGRAGLRVRRPGADRVVREVAPSPSGGAERTSADSRSATRSSADSIPTDSRTRFLGAANGASAVDACVIRAGCSIRLSTPPRLSASFQIASGRRARPPPPRSRRGTRSSRRSRASAGARSRGRGATRGPGRARARRPACPRGRRRRGARSRSAAACGRRASSARAARATRRRARHRAERLLEEEQALGDRRVVRRREAADDVGMAAEVLRRRVHDDVGAELERALEVRRGEGVVDDDDRAGRVRRVRDVPDVDDVQERVRRRLDPDDPCPLVEAVGEPVRTSRRPTGT